MGSLSNVTSGDLFQENKRLLDGADVDAKDKSEQTILSKTAGADYPALVKQLLDNGADVNVKGSDGRTALF